MDVCACQLRWSALPAKKRVCVALFLVLVNYFNYFHVVVMRGFYLLIGSARHTRRIKIIAGVPGKYSTHCILIDCDAIFNLLLSNPPEDS